MRWDQGRGKPVMVRESMVTDQDAVARVEDPTNRDKAQSEDVMGIGDRLHHRRCRHSRRQRKSSADVVPGDVAQDHGNRARNRRARR